MFEREAVLARFVGAYYRRLTADLPEDRLGAVAVPGLKPPVWILGHLAIANDLALRMLGLPTTCPESWTAAYRPGSDPAAPTGVVPSKQELIGTFLASHEAILEGLPKADPAAMSDPHGLPMAILAEFTPTKGDLLAHLLTTHPSVHLGQLSTWRRVMGLPEVIV